MDARFRCPFNMQVIGPSQSGKSCFVTRLITYQKDLFEQPVSSIKWYSPHTDNPKITGVEFIIGLPWEEEEEEEDNSSLHKLIVLDDYAHECQNSKNMTKFITQHSHHRRTSIIQITQNLFWSGSESRNSSLNMHYMVLMRQQRDQKQIRTLANQLSNSKGESKNILSAYRNATQRQFGYLLISLHPRDHPELLLRTNIFPEEATSASVFILPKKGI